jgi:hypothetical protein
MEEQANNEAGGSAQGPAPRSNAGRFRPGDARINRGGRPKKAWADCADRAPSAGPLMLLRVPGKALAHRLSHQHAPWLRNLPADCTIVDCRVDVAREAVAFVIRSEAFPRVAKGAPLPEFKPEFNGLLWGRW